MVVFKTNVRLMHIKCGSDLEYLLKILKLELWQDALQTLIVCNKMKKKKVYIT
jgi:hypothetical protein